MKEDHDGLTASKLDRAPSDHAGNVGAPYLQGRQVGEDFLIMNKIND